MRNFRCENSSVSARTYLSTSKTVRSTPRKYNGISESTTVAAFVDVHCNFYWTREFKSLKLALIFLPFGNAISRNILRDRFTGQSKCFGFVSFTNPFWPTLDCENGRCRYGKKAVVRYNRSAPSVWNLRLFKWEPTLSFWMSIFLGNQTHQWRSQ